MNSVIDPKGPRGEGKGRGKKGRTGPFSPVTRGHEAFSRRGRMPLAKPQVTSS